MEEWDAFCVCAAVEISLASRWQVHWCSGTKHFLSPWSRCYALAPSEDAIVCTSGWRWNISPRFVWFHRCIAWLRVCCGKLSTKEPAGKMQTCCSGMSRQIICRLFWIVLLLWSKVQHWLGVDLMSFSVAINSQLFAVSSWSNAVIAGMIKYHFYSNA